MGAGAHWDGRRHVAAAARAPPGPFGVWQVDVENGPRCSTAFVPDACARTVGVLSKPHVQARQEQNARAQQNVSSRLTGILSRFRVRLF